MSATNDIKIYSLTAIDKLIIGNSNAKINPYVYRGIFKTRSETVFIYICANGRVTFVKHNLSYGYRIELDTLIDNTTVSIKLATDMAALLTYPLTNKTLCFKTESMPDKLTLEIIESLIIVNNESASNYNLGLAAANHHTSIPLIMSIIRLAYSAAKNNYVIKAVESEKLSIEDLKSENAALKEQLKELTNKHANAPQADELSAQLEKCLAKLAEERKVVEAQQAELTRLTNISIKYIKLQTKLDTIMAEISPPN